MRSARIEQSVFVSIQFLVEPLMIYIIHWVEYLFLLLMMVIKYFKPCYSFRYVKLNFFWSIGYLELSLYLLKSLPYLCKQLRACSCLVLANVCFDVNIW